MKLLPRLWQLSVFAIIFSVLVFVSCQKENSQDVSSAQEEQVATASATADAEAETAFNEFFDDAMGTDNDLGVSGSGVFYNRVDTLVPVARCFTVMITHPQGTFFPAHVVIDFGTGCTGPDGHTRRGKMIIDYTGRLVVPGSVATTTFDGFYVDSFHIQGTHRIENISIVNPPTAVVRKYKVDVVGGKITKPDGSYTEWNSTRTVTQIEGTATPDFPRDDIFKIEGSANGVNRHGNLAVRWQSTITEPLIRRFTCHWIVKGRVRTVRENLPNPANSPWVGILDFGIGNCDNQATLTVNGVTRQITLP